MVIHTFNSNDSQVGSRPKSRVDLRVLLNPEKILFPFCERRDEQAVSPFSIELHLSSFCNYNCYHCSFIILDTPPVLGLPDTLSLASKVDGVVLVIQSYKASYKSVLRAREAIEMVNGRILGAILNKVRPEPFGYYYGGYHGYYHGYYYHRYGKEVEEPGQPEGTRTRETEK